MYFFGFVVNFIHIPGYNIRFDLLKTLRILMFFFLQIPPENNKNRKCYITLCMKMAG